MADIKINQMKKCGYGIETTLELVGVDYVNDDLIKILLTGIQPQQQMDTSCENQIKLAQSQSMAINKPNMRKVIHTSISPAELKKAIEDGRGPEIIAPFDEIDITMDTGDLVTVVCGYVNNKMARFIFKDCWANAVMNKEATNQTGYYKSLGRKHVLEDILPHIAQDWQAIFKPRQLKEIVDGETVEYADPLWLPSATDMFGLSKNRYWKDVDDSFQLEIFKTERDRVKRCIGNESCRCWLRSMYTGNATHFCHVSTSGGINALHAYCSLGFAPGFDI